MNILSTRRPWSLFWLIGIHWQESYPLKQYAIDGCRHQCYFYEVFWILIASFYSRFNIMDSFTLKTAPKKLQFITFVVVTVNKNSTARLFSTSPLEQFSLKFDSNALVPFSSTRLYNDWVWIQSPFSVGILQNIFPTHPQYQSLKSHHHVLHWYLSVSLPTNP